MMPRLILILVALVALAATKPTGTTTRSSAKPQADSRGAPNPAAVVTDASNEPAPATRTATTATTKKIASTKTSATKTSATTTAASQPQSKPVPLLSAEDAART